MARLHTHEHGPIDGRQVLVVHGVRGTGARFRRLAGEIGGVRLLAPDLRGHGRSTWDPPWDADTHVADLIETLDDLGLERAPVVGHSFGGLLAMRLAAAAPERVSSLALLDPAAALSPEGIAEMLTEDLDAIGRGATFADEDAARDQWLSVRPPEGRWALEDDIRAFLVPVEGGGLRWAYSREAAVCAWSAMAHAPPSLGDFGGPVMLVVARAAAFVTPDLELALRDEAGTRLERVEIDSGHMLMWDAPEALAAALACFLAPSTRGLG